MSSSEASDISDVASEASAAPMLTLFRDVLKMTARTAEFLINFMGYNAFETILESFPIDQFEASGWLCSVPSPKSPTTPIQRQP